MLLLTNALLKGKEELQGILIENEKIIEIADTNNLLKKYPNVKRYDVNGRRVLPGLNDSHLHLIGYSRLKRNVRLENARSIDEVIELGRKYLESDPEIIIGNLYNDNNFKEKRLLLKEDLDLISKEIPIIFYRVCGHICTINSKAIELLNLDTNIKVEGGSLDSKNGELTGVVRENAMDVLNPLYNKEFSVEDYKDFILDGIKDANMVGLTSLQPNDISGSLKSGMKVYQAYKELAEEGKLNARIYHQITFDNVEDLDSFLNFVDYENDYLKIGPLKLFIDGSLGARTAALYDNYINDIQNGIICLTKENLNEFVSYMENRNGQIIIHAIGDRGIDIVLNEFERVNKGKNENRNGIVHVQITSKEILNRFNELKICALVQPIFINTDMFMVYDRVSEELANTSYAFKTLNDATFTSFSSDAPVESFNPFLGIYHAVTRKDLSGKNTYISTEAVDLDTAINAYTVNGAYMSFEEDIKGKVEVGYLADLIVLDDDIYNIDLNDIKGLSVSATIIGGRIVYEK